MKGFGGVFWYEMVNNLQIVELLVAIIVQKKSRRLIPGSSLP